jgi:hypothetical protein
LGAAASPSSLHRYAYVRNNPINLTDPSGLDPSSKVVQDQFENDRLILNQEGHGSDINAGCTGLHILGQVGQYAIKWQGLAPRIMPIRFATSDSSGNPAGGGGGSGGRGDAREALRRMGLEGVELAGRSFNSGRKALEHATALKFV